MITGADFGLLKLGADSTWVRTDFRDPNYFINDFLTTCEPWMALPHQRTTRTLR